jgi:hypothetical protein
MTSRDDLRIGDAERDAAMTALREHYAQGRLTHEELDERLELTLSARTGRELALAGADLPDLHGSHSEDPRGFSDHDHPGHGGPGWAWRHGGAEWAWRHGGAGWGHHRHAPHPAAWHHRHPARRGGAPFFPILILLLIVGVATAGFGVLKFVFLAWLVVAVLGMFHRRHRHPRARARRGDHPGPF